MGAWRGQRPGGVVEVSEGNDHRRPGLGVESGSSNIDCDIVGRRGHCAIQREGKRLTPPHFAAATAYRRRMFVFVSTCAQNSMDMLS